MRGEAGIIYRELGGTSPSLAVGTTRVPTASPHQVLQLAKALPRG
jgi:hypothetical protein